MIVNLNWIMFFVDGLICGIYWILGYTIDLTKLYSRNILGDKYIVLLGTSLFTNSDVFDMMLYIATSAHHTFVFITGMIISILILLNQLYIKWCIIGYVFIILWLSLIIQPCELFGNEPNSIIMKKILKKSLIKCPNCKHGFNELSIIELKNNNIKHVWC